VDTSAEDACVRDGTRIAVCTVPGSGGAVVVDRAACMSRRVVNVIHAELSAVEAC